MSNQVSCGWTSSRSMDMSETLKQPRIESRERQGQRLINDSRPTSPTPEQKERSTVIRNLRATESENVRTPESEMAVMKERFRSSISWGARAIKASSRIFEQEERLTVCNSYQALNRINYATVTPLHSARIPTLEKLVCDRLIVKSCVHAERCFSVASESSEQPTALQIKFKHRRKRRE